MKTFVRRFCLTGIAPFLWLATIGESNEIKKSIWTDWLDLWDTAEEKEDEYFEDDLF